MARDYDRRLVELLAIKWPIIQAPMAGVSTPAMAAAVSNCGGLGSLGIGAMNARDARAAIVSTRSLTDRPFNVNVFCHRPAVRSAEVEAAWVERLRPEFEKYGERGPSNLSEIYKSFVEDDALLAVLLEERPAVVSFHFGLPSRERIEVLRNAGIVLLASVTNLSEANLAAAAGVHALVAQGYEAGGHRGVFDPDAPDNRLGTFALTRLVVRDFSLPVVAAGGIMDGAGIGAALQLGARAAQLGTAFIACRESRAEEAYRAALFSDAAHSTIMTRAISGRPARCLANRFTVLAREIGDQAVPSYPVAYDADKALHAAAVRRGESGFGTQWAGQGAPLARRLDAGALMTQLVAELRVAANN